MAHRLLLSRSMNRFATDRGEPAPVVLAGHRVIEQLRDEAMFLLDMQGRVASWNEGVRLILGWERDDWIGQPVQVAFTPEDVQAGVPQAEMALAQTQGRADDNRWMQRRNGERFFALGSMTRMLDDEGHPVGYLKALRDFTGPRQAEQERDRLLASEAQARGWAESQAAALTAALDAIADGVLIVDAHGVQRCNAAALGLLGAASVDEVQGGLEALVQRYRLRRERDGPLLRADELPLATALQDRTQGPKTQSLELWATQAGSGADLCLRCVTGAIVLDRQVVGVVAVLGDLSERLQLHQRGRDLRLVQTALQEREAELRALVEGVRDYAIFTIDTSGRISSWHQGAELMKGYTAEEAVGMPFARLFTPEDRAAGRPDWELDVAARTGEYKGEGRRLRKDGRTFDAAVVLTALRDRQGQLLGYLKFTQDISQRRQQEREREAALEDARAARDEAERASVSKDEFLATISHELRTPLSAILGWAHMLERGGFDSGTVRHGLAAISRNARTQVQLIEDLLDMNRIEAGQLRLDLQRTDLGAVIGAAVDSALPAASARRIALRTAVSAANTEVIGDPARLQQVVANLLSNAIKFTPDGGQVNVTLKQHDGHAQIAVADTGQGIEPAFLARMFVRFQQQDATITRRHGGLGLGLAIVRHLVTLQGGTVQAHSAGLGQGATFTVTLPLAQAGALAASPAPARPETEETPWLDSARVLLVDDEPDVRAITAHVLREAGAQVLAAANAEEAMELLRRNRPAVILSDIGMPLVDGYDLMRRVRQLPADAGGQTPAAAFTAYTRPEDRQRALEAGYQLHLAKPVPPEKLVAAVAALLELAPQDHMPP